MNTAFIIDSMHRIRYAADAIEAITMPDTIDELGGERIHNGVYTVLCSLRAELDQATAEIQKGAQT